MKIPQVPTSFRFPGLEPGEDTNIKRLGFSRGVRTSPGVPSGFALIITLSLCVLLTLLAVGLLGLSSISLRTGSRGDDAARAKANARMALMLAIGQLQKHAGSDTRVTAKADLLDQANPPVLGVWKSWEGTDHNADGRPISPGNYESKKEARFLAWLTSSDSQSIPDTADGQGKVALLGAGSVGDGQDREKLQIHLEPTELKDDKSEGAFAWWVSGENQKARIPKPYEPDEDHAARWAVMAKCHAISDPSVFRMDDLLTDAEPARKAVSHLLSDFVGKEQDLKVSQEFYHDLSVTSMGLLTNTATGGWRKDMSLLTENWQFIPNSSLPFFRATPAKDIMFTKPASNPVAAKSMLYPWSAYRGTSEIPIYRHGAVSSWENLKDYATAYKRIQASSSGANRIPIAASPIDDSGNMFNFLHKIRILPVVARVQWVFSYTAAPAVAPAPAGMVEPRVLLTPVITMWNPYNVQISTTEGLSFSIPRPLPAALRFQINGAPLPTYTSLMKGSLNYTTAMSDTDTLRYDIPSTFTLKPGETKVFSPQSTAAVAATNALSLAQGYRATGGHFFQVKGGDGKPLAVGPSSSVKADAKFDTTYKDGNDGVGIYMDMRSGAKWLLAYRMVYKPEMANEVYKPINDLSEVTLTAAMSKPVPFLATVFGARTASNTHIPAKGFLQSSPLVNYTAMGSKDEVEVTIQRHYGGTRHPVNSPFDYSFIRLTPTDSNLPNASDTSGRGYIVTGFNKADGLSRCVIAEIPTRPLQSLCELQNWDLRYENPVPPFAFNLIGNSDASPLIPSNAVVNSTDAGDARNLQHDDSYCANHLLFDDWFFSSIAPDPSSYGNGGSIQKTFTDFISGTAPLGNRAYLPIAEDSGLAASSASEANEIYNAEVKGGTSWKTIASRLEVEGMFNVNSTSVTAWRALLGHARNQRVPYIRESGSSWSVDLSDESDHAVSRFTMAGDVEAKSQGSSGSFPEAAEFAGYRLLDDKMIDALAEEIVNQVRERGPFLSLSEFINRQLSSGELALAGTVQAALNEIAKRGSTNPYSEIERLSNNASSTPPRSVDAEYKFPAAAEGKSAYGLPGWTRQADVLRPIAPILSARDDTFTIRAHGDARDKDGKIVSRAVCEAVVRRTRNYVDAKDAADLVTPPTSPVNKAFGRRFEIVSFRWLGASEI